MSSLSKLWRRIRHAWRLAPLDRRLDEEMQFHLEQATERNIRLGMTPEEARHSALTAFGGVAASKDRTQDEFVMATLREFARDARIAMRSFRRSPAFALATVLTIGLGIGAATAVFSVVHGVLLTPLPYPESDRLVRLHQLNDAGKRTNVSDPNFRDWQTLTHGFTAMAELASWGSVPVVGGSEPIMARVMLVSVAFFDVMGVPPALGRTFAPAEQRLNGTPAVIVSHMFWSRWLGAPQSLSDRSLRIGDRSYAVVGVMPEGFDYPDSTAIWMPKDINAVGAAHESRTAQNYEVVARLRPDIPLTVAQAELSAVSRELKTRYRDGTLMQDAAAVPLLDELTAASRPVIQMLFAAALLLLLVANTNVSSLLLARAAARRHEFALQLAIGAGRARLARQLLAEGTVLCVSGGLLGVAIAIGATRALTSAGPDVAPRLDHVAVDWRALVFAIGLSMLSAVALGLLTMFGTRDVRVSSALADGHRSGTDGRRSVLVRHILVAVQIGMTLVLLAGAGLLGRSFVNVLTVNPGFRVDDAVVLDLTLTNGGSDYRTVKVRFLDALLANLRQLPSVAHVGATTGFPLGGGNYSSGRFLEMTSPDELRTREAVKNLAPAAITARAAWAGYRIVSPDYFQTMGIPLVRGRFFTDSDGPTTPHVALITESLVRAKWPGQDPLGRFVQFGNMDGDPTGFRVIGVVGDVRERTMEKPPGPTFYVSYRQRPISVWAISVIVRGTDAATLIPQARRIVRDLNPELPVEVRTVRSAFDRNVAGRRFSLILIAAFGAAALIIATLGLYGLIAYVVAQRTREIGIRMALGAKTADVIALIVGRGAILAACGTAGGVLAAVILARTVRGLLFDVSATDPVVLGAVAVVTVATSVAASLIPAWRAARIQPSDSLRI